MKLLLALIAIALAGCVSTPDKITGTPAAGALPIPIAADSALAHDLQGAAYNADNAVRVGALPADNPLPKCLHDALQRAGIEPVPGQAAPESFQPKSDGPVSRAITAYVIVQQAAAIKAQGLTVSTDCKALLGGIVIDGLKATNKAALDLIPGVFK